ncbi:MAG: dienelactone hydrolase family protein [Bacteroidota bacterium]
MKIKHIDALIAALFIAACTPSSSTSEEDTSKERTEALKPMVMGEEAIYSTDSTTMVGYLAFDGNDSTKKPGILVVHEWWGHNEYSRERADLLAELGYVALAVDMYGDGKQAAHPDDAGKFAGMVMGNFDDAKARFEAAMNTLKNHPNVDSEKIGAIGYCFGGSVVLSMASAGYDLDAVAAFHAGLGLPVMPDSGSVKGKVLIAQGAEDPFIPEQQVSDFKAAMDAAGANYRYIDYPEAVHAFTSKRADSLGAKFGLPLAYNATADSASWEEMKLLFNDVF